MTQRICTSLKTRLLHLDGLRAALLVVNHQYVARSNGVAVLSAAVVKHGLSSGTACQSSEQQKLPKAGAAAAAASRSSSVATSVFFIVFFFSLFFSGMRKCLCEAASLREGSHGREGLMGMRVGREVMTNIY